MDFTPTKNSQLTACEKLRDTTKCISVIHQTIQEDGRFRTSSPRNSFMDLYRMYAEAMLRKKKDLSVFLSPSLIVPNLTWGRLPV
ncbi:hypothetical protein TNIN_96381 [Trichonephila inaurata madagascariensis]|uniref:Uncharacterized protein n=1 Tax=Trichonephila inaurata madagascariensis TaxID=2747483 RepID=A0A8X7CK48_9ARAC|nr:hypothetical protein TNIN_96381 [Trichonephila inaurata madagascariensis]